MKEERMKILQMIEDGKITVEEAGKLLDNLYAANNEDEDNSAEEILHDFFTNAGEFFKDIFAKVGDFTRELGKAFNERGGEKKSNCKENENCECDEEDKKN
ncbi:MAG: hypothetical protein FWC95_02555 [Defluviitaleaceae bacterium]|nr:hypothetical protein [Defluviitaleaceae bacterium]